MSMRVLRPIGRCPTRENPTYKTQRIQTMSTISATQQQQQQQQQEKRDPKLSFAPLAPRPESEIPS